MAGARHAADVAVLLTFLDEAFERKSWHGPNLKGALRGVTAEQARWRPTPERHSIWELTLHAAYWKYIVRRKILRDSSAHFPLRGSNWFPLPESCGPREWKDHLALLNREHRLLRDAVAGLPDADAAVLRLIRGAAAHDLYHAGQIQLLKRLCPLCANSPLRRNP